METVAGAVRLTAVDDAARASGVRPGLSLADARALLPALAVDDADPAADAALLAAIADWADRYTPLVGLDPPDGLALDVAGCAHLFGGEAAMLADMTGRLAAQGFAVRGAVADTVGAAWALARFAPAGGPGPGPVAEPGGHGPLLLSMPLAALRLPAETVAALDRVGLKRIADVAEAPRAPLTARFGPLLARRLDQAFGREGEAITPRLPAPSAMAERRFAEPVTQLDAVEATVVSLAGSLCEGLEARGEGARLVELALFRADGHVTRVEVGTARPVRTPKALVGLIGERLATRAGGGLDPGFGYDLVRLTVRLAAPLDAAQADLSGDVDRSVEVERLVDRLGARFGLSAVTRFLPLDSHVPELTAALAPAAAVAERALAFADAPRPDAGEPPRFPVRLLGEPELVETVAGVPDGPPLRFRWRRVLYDVVRAEGPERIAPEWWKGEAAFTRDYFRVEDADGRRFWMFRDGLYVREVEAPRWYMHGLFA
ncbi:DNA polymerase Y family protein [Chthonobacter rhizosphaerae]|uniref:Y-family DNA polymerase n=1 Tax=Chthonobacter rhizosphaerae TaxID=2735553 RepID=UPI0031B5A700